MSAAPGLREIVVLTIFPEAFPGSLAVGVVGKAIARGTVNLLVRDLREWAEPPHHQVDDAPFGGGAGMVFKPEPLFRAVRELKAERPDAKTRVVLLDPAGRRLDQDAVRECAGIERLVLVCGRYEGVDERVRQHLVDDAISIGDYVLAGGEVAAMVIAEAAIRLVPGVVGEPVSVERESFEQHRLDHPHYTRPAEFEGMRVPDVLLSGHHAEIERWRERVAHERTRRFRPDLLEQRRPATPERDGGRGETR
jgi:tRNA (guanine37-N1)-methyltransferase